MKYYTITLLITVALFSSGCKSQNSIVSSSENNIISSKMPEFSWDTMPLYMHLRKDTEFTQEELQYLSKFPLITFEKTTGSKAYGSTEAGTIKAAEAVKKLNPKAKILYYKNVAINWGSYKEDEAFLKKYPEALLVNEEGQKVFMPNKRTGFFDLSQENVRSYWLNHVTKMSENPFIDGVFMDANIKILAPAFFNSRVGEEKRETLVSGYLSMMTELKEKLGKDNLLIANILRVRPELKDAGRDYLKFFDGSYIEGFDLENFGMTYEDYLAEGIAAVQQSAREGKVIAMTLGMGKASETAEAGIDDVRQKVNAEDDFSKRLNYILGIFLVCAEKYSYIYPHDGYGINKSAVWLKTFPQYQKKLGAPKGYAKKDGYIYTRSFENLDVRLDIKNKTATLNWK
ncbi:putative glycoside hydrolase [Algibacter miyuki]|uniref:Glycoside hydrolase n=1 Tax=Algibacter miyuki TaxID=1306933 RepID=A0ABV5H2T6_9FLAO|nr:putative glycoside hydrolase [Algibacter miyuki]MDN3663900.1 putative glycoside hydrolase [Algibacter miyuki]